MAVLILGDKLTMSLRFGGTVYSSSFSLMMNDLISAFEEGILSTLDTTSVFVQPRLTIPGMPQRRNLVCVFFAS